MFTIITDRLALVRDLRASICKVTFTKMDGSVTTRFVTLCTMSCITMPAKVRDTLDAEVAGADLQNPRACVLAWDVQGKHIVSFAHDRVSEFYPILDCLC